MEQLTNWLHLGGYGAYVWPAYGVAALVLVGLLWRSLANLRANERLVRQLQDLPLPTGAFTADTPSGSARHEPAH